MTELGTFREERPLPVLLEEREVAHLLKGTRALRERVFLSAVE